MPLSKKLLSAVTAAAFILAAMNLLFINTFTLRTRIGTVESQVRTTMKLPTKKPTTASTASIEKSLFEARPGDEAFWALEWVRAELKKRVTRAKDNLAKVQKRAAG